MSRKKNDINAPEATNMNTQAAIFMVKSLPEISAGSMFFIPISSLPTYKEKCLLSLLQLSVINLCH